MIGLRVEVSDPFDKKGGMHLKRWFDWIMGLEIIELNVSLSGTKGITKLRSFNVCYLLHIPNFLLLNIDGKIYAYELGL